MRRIAALGVVLALAGGACATGSAAGEEVRLVQSALDRADRQGRNFVYQDVTDSQRVEVRGVEADDLRYQATVSIDGSEVFEAIVSDDAFALRLVDPAGSGAPVVTAAMEEDDVAGQALAEGRWVIDFTAAPAVVREQREGEVQVGANPYLDAFYLFQYLDTAINAGAGMERFNPDDIDYNPEDDPWSEDEDRDLEDQGIRRYDLGLPGLPTRSQRGTQQTLPTVRHFRKLAVYLEGETAVQVREQIDISDRREFRRAEQGRAAQYFQDLRDAALAGFTQDPVRERRMSYEIGEFSSDLAVTLPEDVAEVGILAQTIGPRGLGALFEPPPEARRPGVPGTLPSDIPADDQEGDPGGDQGDAGGGDGDEAAQQALRNAVTAALTIYTDSQDFTQATPEALEGAEPSLEYVPDEESTGAQVISVLSPGPDEFRASARSSSGACFSIRAIAEGGTTEAMSDQGACTASAFAPEAYSTGAWGS